MVLDGLAQELRLSRFADDVVGDSHRLCELEVAADEVWQVREVQAQLRLVANGEPLARLLIGDLLPIEACICAEMADDLATSPQRPVANFDFPLHQDTIISHTHKPVNNPF